MGDYFTMIIVVDTATLGFPFADFKAASRPSLCRIMGMQAMMMHEDIVTSLHRV